MFATNARTAAIHQPTTVVGARHAIGITKQFKMNKTMTVIPLSPSRLYNRQGVIHLFKKRARR